MGQSVQGQPPERSVTDWDCSRDGKDSDLRPGCLGCGADMRERHGNAKWCLRCENARTNARLRAKYAARKATDSQ